MQVTVYSRPGCVPCVRVKSWLTEKDIDFTEKNIYDDENAYNELINMGYSGVPVIVTETEHWSGIDLKKMKELL